MAISDFRMDFLPIAMGATRESKHNTVAVYSQSQSPTWRSFPSRLDHGVEHGRFQNFILFFK